MAGTGLMNPLQELMATIRSWLALDAEIYPDEIVTNWIRMAEEYLSEVLRVRHMIQIDHQLLVEGRVELPKDYLQLDTVRFYPQGKPLLYSPRHEFYEPQYDICNRYTIVGNYIIIGNVNTSNNVDVEISYYQLIPPLGVPSDASEEGQTWLYKYNHRLFTLCCLWHASAYAIEDERVGGWQSAVESMVETLNGSSRIAKASGSILVSKRKSFG
jgi:hypothetical protein